MAKVGRVTYQVVLECTSVCCFTSVAAAKTAVLFQEIEYFGGSVGTACPADDIFQSTLLLTPCRMQDFSEGYYGQQYIAVIQLEHWSCLYLCNGKL